MNLINKPDTYIQQAVLALYEQGYLNTNSIDAVILRDLVIYIQKGETLSNKHYTTARIKLHSFEKILDTLNIQVKDDDKMLVKMFNPTTLLVSGFVDRKNEIFLQYIQANKENNTWKIPFSKRNVYALRARGFRIDSRVQAFLDKEYTYTCIDTKQLTTDPFMYQKEGIDFMHGNGGRVILSDEMGLGKSGQAISYAFTSNQSKILIVCPACVKVNWMREVEKWTSELDVHILQGTKPSINKIYAKWWIINYDIFTYWKQYLARENFTCIIFDEVQAIKNYSAKRTQACLEVAKKIPHILALSGTPFESRPIEFWNVINLIDPLLFPNKSYYEKRYCNAHEDHFGHWNVSGSSNTGELFEILKNTFMIRRKKEDVLKELPDKRRCVIPVQLSNKFMHEYIKQEAMLKKAVKERATNKIQSGHLETTKEKIALEKLPMVFSWIDNYLESGNKLIVFAHHKSVIKALSDKYKKICVTYDGSTTTKKRQEAVDRFQTDDKIKLFIGNIIAAGTGITLTAAKDSLTVELAWTSTAHDQCEARNHRVGQKNAVTAYYILAENTIEMMIARILDKKRKIVTAVMDGEEVENEDLFQELLKELERHEA